MTANDQFTFHQIAFDNLRGRAVSQTDLVPIYLVGQALGFILEAWVIFKLAEEVREKHLPPLDAAADQLQWFPYLSGIGILITLVWFRYFTTSKRARLVFE